MLYGDYIDLDHKETKASTSLVDRFALTRSLRRKGLDAPGDVGGHGTGVSTGRTLPTRSFTPRALVQAARNPEAWTLTLAVVGNTVAGGLFLGALLLAPPVLGKLLGLL